MASDLVNQPSGHSQRAMARGDASAARHERRVVGAGLLVVLLLVLAMLFLTGCVSDEQRRAARDLADDLELYVSHTAPAPSLTADEGGLSAKEQNEVLTRRHNLIRTLGEELKKTSRKLEESLR